MSRWFRMYDELLDDPKVQRLRPELFKAWVNLMCLASRHGEIPNADDVAFALRIDAEKAKAYVDELMDLGLIDVTENDEVKPHNWDKRQFKSDRDETAAKRQADKRERDKEKNVTRDITEMSQPPETDTDTDTEQNKPRSSASDGFEEFYSAYPLKKGRGAAIKAHKSATAKVSPALLAVAAKVFAAKCVGKDPKFIPHPATWLNQERWADEDLQPESAISLQVQPFVLENSEAWKAWLNHKGLKSMYAFERKTDRGIVRGAFFPTEYPPAQSEAA